MHLDALLWVVTSDSPDEFVAVENFAGTREPHARADVLGVEVYIGLDVRKAFEAVEEVEPSWATHQVTL